MTPRVVLDTNVVVSALIKPDGLEERVLRLALSGHLILYASPAIFAEYVAVLARPKLKLKQDEIEIVLAELRKASTLVKPTQPVSAAADESDNRFLECAEAADADYIVTGNKRHFPEQWKRTKIVNARYILHSITAL